MSNDPVTNVMRRFSLAAWAMLLIGLAGWVSSGLMDMPPPSQEPRFVPLDIAATISMGMCTLALIVTHTYYDGGSHIEKFLRWAEMLAWSAIDVRFAWVLLAQHDIPIHPLPMVSLLILSLSRIGAQVALWYRRDIDPQFMRTVDPVIESSGTVGIPSAVWRRYFKDDEQPTQAPPTTKD